jgi:hypothetical protein
MGLQTFWLEPTNSYQHELRRYSSTNDDVCPAKPYGMNCHDARVDLGVITAPEHPGNYDAAAFDDDSWKSDRITRDNQRFPHHCECGYTFAGEDKWQVNHTRLYEVRGGERDGERYTLRSAPPGATWDASWYPRTRPFVGPDDLALMVRTPDGWDWHVDGPASNCDKPGDHEHFCWCRHGSPRKADVSVDKIGNTCGAGAGSILTPTWHGFLHHGELHT